VTCTKRLNKQVGALILVAFSASCFGFSSAPRAENATSTVEALTATVHTPQYVGKGNGPVIANIVRSLRAGGLVVVFNPAPGGEISAYAIDGPNVTVTQDGAPPPAGSSVYGQGAITDIQIYKGSDCITCLLNGRRVTVCNN
jgi:hypothetical protein